MTFDFDKVLETMIVKATKNESEKLSFSLGYSAGHIAATKISYTSRASTLVDMIEKYGEKNGQSFVIGYLLGLSDTHMKIMHYESDSEDADDDSTTDNTEEFKTDVNKYNLKQMIFSHSHWVDDKDAS